MKLNLKGVQRVAEDLMLDECQIYRDAEGTSDDTWNPTTGTYTAAADDLNYIYFGKCSVSGNPGGKELQGGQYLSMGQYRMSLPKDAAPQLLPKDRVVITASTQDQLLVGKVFIVDDIAMSTYAVTRRVTMHLLTPVPGSRG